MEEPHLFSCGTIFTNMINAIYCLKSELEYLQHTFLSQEALWCTLMFSSIVTSNISRLFLTLCGTKAIYNYTNKFVADTIILFFFYTKVLLNMTCELRNGFSALSGLLVGK